MLSPQSKRFHFCPSVSALRAQSLRLIGQFGAVDLSHLSEVEGGSDLRKFEAWLATRPERRIAVITHGSDCSIRGSDWARRVDTDGHKWTRFYSVGSIVGI